MGKITKRNDTVTVEFSGGEIVAERAMVSLPQTAPPEAKYAWYDWIGNFIARAAWEKVLKCTTYLTGKQYGSVKVEVAGPVIVTFNEVKDKETQ